MRWLALLVTALALVVAGCGGGSNESAATTDTTTTETATTEETSLDESSTESIDTTELSALASEDCLALASAGATIGAAFAGANGDTEAQEQLQGLVDKVPDEIKADVQTLAAAFSEYAQKLKDIGIQSGATPTADQLQQLQAAIASLDQKELTAASNRIEAWATENCKS